MLKKIRTIAAGTVFILCTLLFLDFTGLTAKWFGWLAKIQFLPAVLAMNAGVVLALVLLTLVFGRLYCSIICPLGIFQDIAARSFKGWRKTHKKSYSWSPEKKWLRYGVLVIFIILLIAGFSAVTALIAPYSSFGRIAQNLFAPVWLWGNNLCAWIAEKAGGFAFEHKEVWIRSLPTFIIASVTFAVLVFLAARNGRTYCNTICPVGTVLSFFSRFAVFRPFFDTSKCGNCHLCEKNCKAACIDVDNHKIDYSRCVDCFDCIDTCKHGAIRYMPFWKAKQTEAQEVKKSVPAKDSGRRAFIGTSALVLGSLALKAQDKKVDGGLATVLGKKAPERETPLVPFGALSVKDFYQHCTACQLCVSVCTNHVLRPSGNLQTFMQPEVSYERGYCRPECVKCSEVCPTGAIRPITKADKTAIQIGHAVLIQENCIVNRDGVTCGNCARHCPTQAILMVAKDPNDPDSPQLPVVNEEKCIGCGACENLCPSRPFSAIYVEGHEQHRNI